MLDAIDVRRAGEISSLSEIGSKGIFVVCASYEPRTRFVTEHLPKSYRCKHSLIYVNSEFLIGTAGEPTKKNLYGMVESLARVSDSVHVIEGSWLSAVGQLREIRETIYQFEMDSGNDIVCDCTTFNREALLTMLLLLRSRFVECRYEMVYCSPKRHGDWLSSGYRSVRNVMGFTGNPSASRPTVLVVLSGFEPHRTQRLIEEHEPYKVLLGFGDPSTAPEFLDRNLAEQQLIRSRQDVDEFRFAASNIEECRMQLKEMLAEYINRFNVVLAPMSTKFSSVACMLVAEEYPDIQITYCLPGKYNIENYSDGVNSVFTETLRPRLTVSDSSSLIVSSKHE